MESLGNIIDGHKDGNDRGKFQIHEVKEILKLNHYSLWVLVLFSHVWLFVTHEP